MEQIIREIVLDVGYVLFGRLVEHNIPNLGIVNIVEHPFDINFISEQMTANIDVLITYEHGTINITTNDDVQADDLINELQNRLNMHRTGNIEPHSYFAFRVITIS